MTFANRFSEYFEETSHRAETNVTGDWLKTFDYDTLIDFIQTLKKIDDTNGTLKENDELWLDYIDLMVLTQRLYSWERYKDLEEIDPTGNLVAEYYFRLANLIEFEYNQRNNIESPNRVLEKDNEKYIGRLAIYD